MKRTNALIALAAATAAIVGISLKAIQSPSPHNPAAQSPKPPSTNGAHAATPPPPLPTDASVSEEPSLEPEPGAIAVEPSDAAAIRELDRPQEQWLAEMREVARHLSSDPTLLAGAVAQLKTETDPEQLALLAQAIAESAATTSSHLPLADLLGIASGNGPTNRREAALHILSRITEITPDVMGTVSGIASKDPAAETRIAAINTMGGWMVQNRGLTEAVSVQLSRAISAEASDQVRGFAIQAIANQDAVLSGEVLETMVGSLRGEPAPINRALAALALGGGESADTRPLILQELKNAYLKEADLDTQRNILTQIARAGKADAPPLLKQLPTPHPYLVLDANDYVDLLQTAGTPDFDRVWEAKSQRDIQRGSILGATR